MERVKTKERLSNAALKLFAQKGFASTKVADICILAEANIAAFNYHFGSKEGLYTFISTQAFLSALPSQHALLEPKESSSKEELYAHIHYLISQVKEPAFDILEHEISNPTGLINKLIQEALSPYEDKLIEHIYKIASSKMDEKNAKMYYQSILSQCLFSHEIKILSKKQTNTSSSSSNNLEEYTQHIYNFSLAGIEAH